jgi:hypothetical protein
MDGRQRFRRRPVSIHGRVPRHKASPDEEAGSALRIPNKLFFQKMFRVSGGDPSSFETVESMAALTSRDLAS